MRVFFSKLIVLPALFALISCKGSNVDSINEQSLTSKDYNEIEAYKISWNDIFAIESNDYYVYFYSTTCSHCKSIKNQIIDYALKEGSMYFIEFSDEVVISKDIKNTIGATSVSELSILGTPSLLEILDHRVSLNIAGSKAILDFLQIPSSN